MMDCREIEAKLQRIGKLTDLCRDERALAMINSEKMTFRNVFLFIH